MTLLGRRAECEELDGVLADALAGRSRVVVLRGEAGAGKSALLHYVSERSDGWQLVRAVGIESELELAYSGLHQLCAPLLDHGCVLGAAAARARGAAGPEREPDAASLPRQAADGAPVATVWAATSAHGS